MFGKKTVRDVEIKDQIVLVRTDYNVPLEIENGVMTVANDFRIRESLPTIRYLLEQGAAKIILISHLGRPDGKDESLSLKPVVEVLAEKLPGVPLSFVDAVVGDDVKEVVEDLPQGGVLLLENLRFEAGEKANAEDFAEEIVEATGATLFVQDGFAVTHRAHASTVAITKFLPAVAGLLLEKEVTVLRKAVQDPERPLVVVIGGAKVEDKQGLIEQFLPVADQIIVGGKIAADGYEASNEEIYVAEDFDENSAGEKLDVGPLATAKIAEMVMGAKTVLWNGVLGKVEDAAYATASTVVAKILGEHPEITSIICGGDTAAFVERLMEEDPRLQYSLVSTGGGAALELLLGGKMPGIDALENR